MRKTVQFLIPASVTYDDSLSTAEAAVADFFRALEESEQVGFMDRQLIDMNYGNAIYVTAPQDAEPETGEDENDDENGLPPSGVLWQPEHPLGHAPYCAHPSHPLGTYCAADPAEPGTLRGQPSQAWLRDHPDPAGPTRTSIHC